MPRRAGGAVRLVVRLLPAAPARLQFRVIDSGVGLHRDFVHLGETLHQLKGSGGVFGFPTITQSAAIAETACRAGADLNTITTEVQQLVHMIRRIEHYDPSRERPELAAPLSDLPHAR